MATAACSAPMGDVLNDATLELYQRIALAQADAGADVVAPERDDGRPGGGHPGRPRRGGHDQVAILAYAANTPRPSTARSATPSTSPSPAVVTAAPTSRTRATGARPWRRSPSTWPKAPT